MSYVAEQNVIGALFIDGSCIDQIYSFLEPKMFTSELLGNIYMEFLKAYDNHQETNAVEILQKLKSDRYPEDVIAGEIKTSVLKAVTSASIKSYADMVYKEYKAECLNQILESTYATPDNLNSCISTLLTQIEALKDDREMKSKPLPVIVRENKGNYFKEHEKPKLDLGFYNLDDMLGGLEGGDMIVIGARPAVGKSAFVTQVASYIAKSGKRIGFYNLEMQEKQVYERFVSAQSGIGLTRIRRALQYIGDEKEKFEKANEELEKRDNIVITTGSKSIGEIRSECRHMGYDIVIIDYMQLLKADKSYRGNRREEVGEISRGIKALAMELNIPVIALSQLNRLSEYRADGEPTMSELREAGDIEQDASIIILLWNTNEDDKSEKGWKTEKNRQGKTGKGKMRFDGDNMKFVEVQGEWQDVQETPFD